MVSQQCKKFRRRGCKSLAVQEWGPGCADCVAGARKSPDCGEGTSQEPGLLHGRGEAPEGCMQEHGLHPGQNTLRGCGPQTGAETGGGQDGAPRAASQQLGAQQSTALPGPPGLWAWQETCPRHLCIPSFWERPDLRVARHKALVDLPPLRPAALPACGF